MSIRAVIRQLITESDNRTHDIARYLAVLSILSGIGLSVAAVWQGVPFAMQDYGIGIGALFAGVGVALGLKKESNDAA